MKYRILTILTIFLIISSGLNIVSANMNDENSTNIQITRTESIKENRTEEDEETKRIGETVSATSDGYQNITFDDGYNGYCANKYLKDANIGDTFIVQNTSQLINPNYNESVGNYLKILFVDHYDYVMQNQLTATLAVWEFTDNPYKNDSYMEIIPTILKEAQEGRIIPDHGEIKKINNTTEAIFDFECLQSTDDKIQNFFGYKVTFRDIVTEIMNNTEITDDILTNEPLENDTITDNNNTTQNNTQTKPENNNNTTQNNQTTDNNNTTQNNTQTKPENNNNTIPNNETIDNNDTIMAIKNKTGNNMTLSNNDNNSSKMGEEDSNRNLEKENNNHQPINIIKHQTGNNTVIGLGLLLFLTIFLVIKYVRD